MSTERWPLTIAIAALAVSVIHIIVNVVLHHRTGATIRVRPLRVEKHPYNPLEHRLVVTVVADGRLPAIVKQVGVIAKEIYIDAAAPDGGSDVPRTLLPGESLTAEVSVGDVANRVRWDFATRIIPWAVDGSGTERLGRSRMIKIPARPKEG